MVLCTLAGMAVVFAGAMFFARSRMHPLSTTPAAPSFQASENPQANESPELAALHAQKIGERLGNDDGFALAIFYGGSIDGSLETCG